MYLNTTSHHPQVYLNTSHRSQVYLSTNTSLRPQVYLDTVLAHPLLSQCLAVKRFLDPPNYPDSMEGEYYCRGGSVCGSC